MDWLKKDKVNRHEPVIERLLLDLSRYHPTDEEYEKALTALERVSKLEADEKKRERVSPDTKWQVAGSLLGVLMIVTYERSHVITSKALTMLNRPSN